jgi:hypothetical protein
LLLLSTPEVFWLIIAGLLGFFLFVTLVNKMVLLPKLVVQVHEALIIDPQIKLIAILKKAKQMLSYLHLIR